MQQEGSAHSELPASRSLPRRSRVDGAILLASVSEPPLGSHATALGVQVPRSQGTAHPSSVTRARGLGSCSSRLGASARAGAARTPRPGGRRGSARGAGGGAARPFKPFRAAPRAAAGDGATRGPSRRGGGSGGALRGGAYWAPSSPGPAEARVPGSRGLADLGLRAPTRAGAGRAELPS